MKLKEFTYSQSLAMRPMVDTAKDVARNPRDQQKSGQWRGK